MRIDLAKLSVDGLCHQRSLENLARKTARTHLLKMANENGHIPESLPLLKDRHEQIKVGARGHRSIITTNQVKLSAFTFTCIICRL